MMTLAGVAFVGYGLVFLVLALIGSGFDSGYTPVLNWLGRTQKRCTTSTHLHVASLDSS